MNERQREKEREREDEAGKTVIAVITRVEHNSV